MTIGSEKIFIELQQKAESVMRLDVCSGCDACGLRCAAGVPAAQHEWDELQSYLSARSPSERAAIERVTKQVKQVDLGDDVFVTMCRYRDIELGRCSVYPARPLACRVLGHLEWMPCPIDKVPVTVPVPLAMQLMASYAELERKTFEEWEEGECLG